jgi:hypothetical protein
MFETSQGPEVATHQRLLFRTRLASRSMLRPKYHIWDDLCFRIHKGVAGEGALQCIRLVLVLLVGCATKHVRGS